MDGVVKMSPRETARLPELGEHLTSR